jgi:TP901 family phage tail tape measure protein
MAFDISYTIEAIDKFSATSKRIEKAVGRVDKKVERFSSRASRRFAKVGAAFAGVFTAAAGARVLGVFKNVGAGFEDQLADLSAITGATGKDLDILKGKAFDLGKEFATSGADVLEGFKLVGSAKAELLENIPALIETTKQVLLLKNAAGVDLASAAEITAQSLNIFSKGADQAGRFVNVLAAGAKEGASEVADTGQAMLIAGPIASKLGLSFESVNALLQGIAQGGIKGARAGTGLQAVLQRLSKEGVDFSKIGLSDLFVRVGEVIEGTGNAADKATIIQRLFGLEHQKTGLTLTTQAKTIDKLTRRITGTNIAQEQANIRLNTFNARMRRLGAITEEKIVAAFIRLGPTIEGIVVKFGEFIEKIQPEDVEKFADSLASIATALANISRLIGVGGKLAALRGLDPLGLGNVAERTGGIGESIGRGVREFFTGGKDKSAVDVNVTLSGNTGAVQDVKTNTTGNASLKVGQNMVPAT